MKTLKLQAPALYAAELLTRSEMKNVLGAYMRPPGCTNDCGGTMGACQSGQTCSNKVCPDDANYTHNVCG